MLRSAANDGLWAPVEVVTSSMSLQEPALKDLTSRARIRDAALRLFGERGVDATRIREIARVAAVSGGLVRHHFGSKDDLRAACDSYALQQLVRIKERAILDRDMAKPGFLSSAQPALLVIVKYLVRSMVDGSSSAASMYDQIVELMENWLVAHHEGEMSDPRALAALLVAMELGVLVMREQLSRALGADILGPEGHLRWTRAKVELYSDPLLSPEQATRARAAIDQAQQAPSGTPGTPTTRQRTRR
jgi:TetR/AcrR family transcriptional regulator, regulator of cefoperazone and chloramphenicol sensitivity